MLLLGLRTIAGTYEYGSGIDRPCRLDVTQRDTDYRYTLQRDIVALGDFQIEAGLGFAANAFVVGSVGTEQYRSQVAAMMLQHVQHLLMNTVESFDGE